MGRIITIYCEGKKGSHDFDILEKVVGDFVTIKPIGGKKGANAIIEHLERGTVKSDYHLFFRDRDFDCPVPQYEKLFFDGKKTYYSYRTTIENYLLDVSLFFEFLKAKGLSQKYQLHTTDDVKNIFITIAKELKNYQAVRHTLGALRFANTFDTTWMREGSGNLPESLELEICQENGWNLVQNVIDRTHQKWTKAEFDSILNRYLDLFNDDFFENLQFLVYYQGKDFSKMITNKLTEFPLKDYYKFAKERFNYEAFEDLKELRTIVEEKREI